MALHGTGRAQDVATVLAQSAVAVSHTGDTNETTIATAAIPAGAMGANGQVEIISLWTYTNSGNTKTLRIKFGGTNFLALATTTTASIQAYTRIANRNNAASQIGHQGSNTGFNAQAGAVLTGAIDTTAAVNITFTAQLASAGETITLESYRIIMMPKV